MPLLFNMLKLHGIIIIISVFVLCTNAETIHVIDCVITNNNVVEAYASSQPNEVQDWASRFSEMIDPQALKVNDLFSCEIYENNVVTNNLTEVVPYLLQTTNDNFTLKSDVTQGRIVECVIHEYHGEYAYISLSSIRRVLVGREVFSPVPGWDVGQPIIEEYSDIGISKKLFLINQWDVFSVTLADGQIELTAVKIENKVIKKKNEEF